MRTKVVFNIAKEDLYHNRRKIYSCLLISLLLGLLAGWKSELLLRRFGMDATDSSVVLSALLIIIPYMILWIVLTVRLRREKQEGFYLFARTMPVTPEETVTAKFLVSFILSVGSILWFVLFWWGYTDQMNYPAAIEEWGTIYVFTFYLSAWLAIHHAMFFRSGANETWGIYMVLVIIFFLANRSFVKSWHENFSRLLHDYPVFMIGMGTLPLLALWWLCWRWGKKSYSEYL